MFFLCANFSKYLWFQTRLLRFIKLYLNETQLEIPPPPHYLPKLYAGFKLQPSSAHIGSNTFNSKAECYQTKIFWEYSFPFFLAFKHLIKFWLILSSFQLPLITFFQLQSFNLLTYKYKFHIDLIYFKISLVLNSDQALFFSDSKLPINTKIVFNFYCAIRE